MRNPRIAESLKELDEAGTDSPPHSLRKERGAAHASLLYFRLPELWENKFLRF